MEDVQQLVLYCLVSDPQQRPSIDNVIHQIKVAQQ